MRRRRCNDPLNHGCVTLLSRYNYDDTCGPCRVSVDERRRAAVLEGETARARILEYATAGHSLTVTDASRVGDCTPVIASRLLVALVASGELVVSTAQLDRRRRVYVRAAGDSFETPLPKRSLSDVSSEVIESVAGALEDRGAVMAAEIASAVQLSERTVRKALKVLRDEGRLVVDQDSRRRAAVYRLADSEAA